MTTFAENKRELERREAALNAFRKTNKSVLESSVTAWEDLATSLEGAVARHQVRGPGSAVEESVRFITETDVASLENSVLSHEVALAQAHLAASADLEFLQAYLGGSEPDVATAMAAWAKSSLSPRANEYLLARSV